MISSTNVLSSPRMGGQVLRYHTWPTIHKQTVADHCFHQMRIYWQVFGSVSSTVCEAIIFSDLGEVVTGDLPHPIKRNNPVLKAEVNRLDDEAIVSMIGSDRARRVGQLTPTEIVRIKACDLLEMAEFASVEKAMGNRFADAIIVNVYTAIQSLVLSDEDRALVEEHWQNEIRRWEK